MKIYFVTGNEKKAREAAEIVPNVERIKLDLPEIQSLDPREILEAKLKEAHKIHPDKVLVVEDIAYTVKGLNGLPGTLIKWFEITLGAEGVAGLVEGRDNTTVVSDHIGLIKPDGEMIIVKGEVQGKTVAPAGRGGFGFDSIFMPDGHDKRYSEMTYEQKNKISHRALAWKALKEKL